MELRERSKDAGVYPLRIQGQPGFEISSGLFSFGLMLSAFAIVPVLHANR